MKKIPLKGVLFLSLLLPGCTRIARWASSNFYQAKSVRYQPLDTARQYVRTSIIYDQFNVKARFTALLLASEVRRAYVELHTQRTGKDLIYQESAWLRQEQEETQGVSFYITADTNIVLGSEQSEWSLFMIIGEAPVQPVSVKVVELLPEYKVIFGAYCNRFRTTYKVDFPIVPLEERPVRNNIIALVFQSMHKRVVMKWYLSLTGALLASYSDGNDDSISYISPEGFREKL